MKRPAVMFSEARPAVSAELNCPFGATAVTLLAAALLFLVLACVTPLPRPGETTPTPVATETPAARATPVVLPTATPAPTPTAIPTRTPTRGPDPTTQAETPTSEPSPVPTVDPSGLALQVYAPEDGSVVPGSEVAVYGQTSPGARVFIGGEETGVDAQGGFKGEASLAPEENEVVIVALDEEGRRRSISRTVTSLALPFLLLVTEPENESIVSESMLRLSGRTGPNAIVSINGRSVPVDRFGHFSSSVTLVEGPNVIDVVATNDDGSTFSKVLAVIYRAPIE